MSCGSATIPTRWPACGRSEKAEPDPGDRGRVLDERIRHGPGHAAPTSPSVGGWGNTSGPKARRRRIRVLRSSPISNIGQPGASISFTIRDRISDIRRPKVPSESDRGPRSWSRAARWSRSPPHAIERLIRVARGRPIVIPLSGGRDSRLIAMKLKQLAYNDVYCYSYGSLKHQEALESPARLQRNWGIPGSSPDTTRTSGGAMSWRPVVQGVPQTSSLVVSDRVHPGLAGGADARRSDTVREPIRPRTHPRFHRGKPIPWDGSRGRKGGARSRQRSSVCISRSGHAAR